MWSIPKGEELTSFGKKVFADVIRVKDLGVGDDSRLYAGL